jgi:molybdate transport system regulatory protein
MARLSIRVDLASSCAIGPGKIRLLEVIDETGSISAAGRAMDMSYRRAWMLLDELNHIFVEPVTTTTLGGRSGGGASLTPFGRRLVASYRKMETDAHAASSEFLTTISDTYAPAGSPSARARKTG